MRLRVTYLDGSEAEVVATASARRQFESTHGEALLQAVGSYRSYWADELAHSSLVQTTDEARSFDEWIDAVQTVEYEVPAGRLVQLAEVLGMKVTAEDVKDVTPTPTGGAAKARSRAKSSKPRSTPASPSTG